MLYRNSSDNNRDCAEAFLELADRLHNGERNVAAEMLRCIDESERDTEFAIDLIYREFLILQELGHPPETAIYCAQFPQLEHRLRRLLEVDRVFNGKSGDSENLTVGNRTEAGDTVETTLSRSEESVVGRYQLLHQIGRGGSSRVYKATQIGIDRVVAIKLLSSNVFDPQLEKRFRHEAESIARLQHPNIVQLYDYGCEEGQFFLVTEMVDGGGLDQRSDQSLNFAEIVRLMIKLADTVQFAHGRNIIHRDLKPSNILLTPSLEPKITDFGLAKNLESVDSAAATKTGSILGTPSYMAPEQIYTSSRATGPATDIYGLGAVLYQLLTGRPPFIGEDIMATLQLVQETEPIAPSRLRPGLPRDLEVICLKCLQKEPARRFATAKELSAELQRFVDGVPIHSRAIGRGEKAWRWCCRRPLVAGLYAGLILAVVAGLSGVLWQWQEAKSNARVAESRKKQSDENFQQAKQAIERLTELTNSLAGMPGTDQIRERALEEVIAFYMSQVENLDDPQTRYEAAEAYRKIASIRRGLNEYDKALEDLTRALDILKDLTKSFPKNTQYMSALAGCRFEQGSAFQLLRRSEDALDSFLESAELAGLCWEMSGRGGFRLYRACALNNASGILFESGKIDRAYELNDQALVLFESRTDKDPARYYIDHAIALENRASFLQRQGKDEEAINCYEKAIDLHEDSLGPDSEASGYKLYYLARSHDMFARFLISNRSKADSWLPHVRRAQEVYALKWSREPAKPLAGFNYAALCWLVANKLWLVGDRSTAAEMYRIAIDTYVDMRSRFPKFSHEMSRDHDEIAYRLCLLWSICPVDELRDTDAALRLSRRIVEERPTSAVAHSASAIVESLYGDVDIAAQMLRRELHIDKALKPEINRRLMELVIRFREGGKELSNEESEFLHRTVEEQSNDAGFSRQLAERIIRMTNKN